MGGGFCTEVSGKRVPPSGGGQVLGNSGIGDTSTSLKDLGSARSDDVADSDLHLAKGRQKLPSSVCPDTKHVVLCIVR